MSTTAGDNHSGTTHGTASVSVDPCDHDKGGGSAGGVSPLLEDEEGPHGEDPAGIGGGVAGGVSPGSATDSHTGDDDCNCN